jgi:hypothetical protein
MCLIFLLALMAIALSIYVMNFTLLATIAVILLGLLSYFYATRTAPFNFRAITYSVLAIDLLYIFLVLLTVSAFTQYSVAHNAAKLLGKQSARVKVVVASVMLPTVEYDGSPNASLRWSRVLD